MAKNTYETYEFLQTSAEEADAGQFFVVQDNGTFLINRPVQYVTQVEDVKGALGELAPNVVYDVETPHFYVEADNSSQLISVPDQLILQNGDTNGYFLQPVTHHKEEEMEEGEEHEYKNVSEITSDVNVDEESSDSKTTTDCTEITLTDDQYQLLEQKGWILLETNDKIYLLNTLGLHDITSDEKLIQSLRSELQTEVKEEEISLIDDSKTDLLKRSEENVNESNETVHFTMRDDESMQVVEKVEKVKPVDNNEPSDNSKSQINAQDLPLVRARNKNDIILNNNIKDSMKREISTIKIKTKYLFKDIPPEIILGKTVNGKNLVARVVKTEKPMMDPNKQSENAKLVSEQNNQQMCDTGLNESIFEKLIQQRLRSTGHKCTIMDMNAAETVVHQLLRVPAFKPAVIERYLIVTKVIVLEDKPSNICKESIPTLVMGRLVHEHGGWRFIYLPDLLNKLLEHEEKNSEKRTSKESDEGSFLHIHIRESKGVDGIVRISITLNKRHLPARIINEAKQRPANTVYIRQPGTVFACSACATVFRTEQELKIHQEAECMDTDDALTIETESNTNTYTVVKSGKLKQYVCNQCNTIFSKLTNCQKHIGTHFINTKEESGEGTEELSSSSKPESVFKCKMCPSTYIHAASLSKHIVTKHIRVQSK